MANDTWTSDGIHTLDASILSVVGFTSDAHACLAAARRLAQAPAPAPLRQPLPPAKCCRLWTSRRRVSAATGRLSVPAAERAMRAASRTARRSSAATLARSAFTSLLILSLFLSSVSVIAHGSDRSLWDFRVVAVAGRRRVVTSRRRAAMSRRRAETETNRCPAAPQVRSPLPSVRKLDSRVALSLLTEKLWL